MQNYEAVGADVARTASAGPRVATVFRAPGSRRRQIRGWAVTTLSLLALILASSPTVLANPIVQPVAADPSIIRAPDGKYYMYTTADDWGDGHGVRNMSIFTSFDLVNWMYVGDVFTDRPAWHAPGKLAWAPDVHVSNGRYNLYYALNDVSNPCIGLATASSPTGPWTDLGRAVFCAHDVGVAGTIDPFVWDDGASKTMIVGNFRGVYAIALNADGSAAAGKPVQIADNRFEGPFVEYRNGYYYLYVSAGNCCNGANAAYRVLVGRSTSLTGPYVDRKGQDLNNGGGELVLAGSDAWAGPGHNTVVTDDAGDSWIVYHAIPRNNLTLPSGAQRREGMIDRIVWVNDWPKVGDGSPSSTGPALPKINLPVRVSLTATGPTTLPATGGTIEATMHVEAPADRPYSGQVWASVASPNNRMSDPIFGPTNVDLHPGEVIDYKLTYAVPLEAAAGTYYVYAFAGTYATKPVDFGTVTGLKTGITPVGNPLSVSASWRNGS